MPVRHVTGDPLLTRAQTLAFGHNARARTEVGPLEARLMDAFPAAFATYRKACHAGRVKAGTLWTWRDSQPNLSFLVIRETNTGATRPRYVESILLTLARDWQLHGLTSLALAPLGDPLEWPTLLPLVDTWLERSPLRLVVYEQYVPGVDAEGET